MDAEPDLTLYYAIHRQMRVDTARYATAVQDATEGDRRGRVRALARWARGFAYELDDHHYVEDAFFLPSLWAKVPSVARVLDDLDADHRAMDEILARWTGVAARLADPQVPFGPAKDRAVELAVALRDLLDRHLEVENREVLPLFSEHYAAAEYDAVFQQAVAGGRKTGLWFIVPWNVDALPPEARDALVAAVPPPMQAFWAATRDEFRRLVDDAFGGVQLDRRADVAA